MSLVHKSRELNEMTSINSKKAAIIGTVGVALALLVAPLSLASADGGSIATACVRATSDGNRFVGQSGGCKTPSGETTNPVIDCAASDEAVSAVATAQVTVARLNDSVALFESALQTEVTDYTEGSGSPLRVALVGSAGLSFTLDSDEAASAFCKNGDALAATQVSALMVTNLDGPSAFGSYMWSFSGDLKSGANKSESQTYAPASAGQSERAAYSDLAQAMDLAYPAAFDATVEQVRGLS
jgi:hypothetical protein